MTDTIYMDYAASTPIDPRVHDEMIPFMRDHFGNPGGRTHTHSMNASRGVETARGQLADFIGGAKDGVVFTSCATEANNLALFGMLDHLRASGKTHIITTAVEHRSVLGPLEQIEKMGFTVTRLMPKPCGMVEGKAVQNALTPDTGLVSIMGLNNEIGTIMPLAEVRAVLPDGVVFHTDAAQTVGKCHFTLADNGNPDLVTLSSHKINGPKGIGALYIAPSVRPHIRPIMFGGGQEGGLRPGSVPADLCVGFGLAAELARIELADDLKKMDQYRTLFLKKLTGTIPDIVVHGHSDAAWRAPNILNIRIRGVSNEDLIAATPYLSFTPASACGTGGGKKHISHVIRAITNNDEQAGMESLRLSFGRFTSEMEIINAADMIIAAVNQIKSLQEVA